MTHVDDARGEHREAEEQDRIRHIRGHDFEPHRSDYGRHGNLRKQRQGPLIDRKVSIRGTRAAAAAKQRRAIDAARGVAWMLAARLVEAGMCRVALAFVYRNYWAHVLPIAASRVSPELHLSLDGTIVLTRLARPASASTLMYTLVRRIPTGPIEPNPAGPELLRLLVLVADGEAIYGGGPLLLWTVGGGPMERTEGCSTGWDCNGDGGGEWDRE